MAATYAAISAPASMLQRTTRSNVHSCCARCAGVICAATVVMAGGEILVTPAHGMNRDPAILMQHFDHCGGRADVHGLVVGIVRHAVEVTVVFDVIVVGGPPHVSTVRTCSCSHPARQRRVPSIAPAPSPHPSHRGSCRCNRQTSCRPLGAFTACSDRAWRDAGRRARKTCCTRSRPDAPNGTPPRATAT